MQYPANDPHHSTRPCTATHTCPHLTAESNKYPNGHNHVARSTQPCNILSPHDWNHRHTGRRVRHVAAQSCSRVFCRVMIYGWQACKPCGTVSLVPQVVEHLQTHATVRSTARTASCRARKLHNATEIAWQVAIASQDAAAVWRSAVWRSDHCTHWAIAMQGGRRHCRADATRTSTQQGCTRKRL
jgi:hypothetical protein